MNKPIIPVTVVIPNYNSGIYLEDCIKSINCGQWPVEILIVDDCSTDDSFNLAIKLKLKYSNIRVLQLKENGGAAEARKFGIAEATQDWVAFIDADDFIEEDAVESAYVKARDECSDICIWDMWRFDAGRSWCSISLNPTDFPKSGRQAVIETLGQWKIHPLGVAKKEIYLNAYLGFEEKHLNADELITRLFFAAANKVSFCKKRYFYRVNPNSSTQKISAKRLTTLRSYIWLINFSKNYPEVRVEHIGVGAISQAWYFFKNRKIYGCKVVGKELKIFIKEFSKCGDLLNWLWRYPKHLIAFLIILFVYRLNISR